MENDVNEELPKSRFIRLKNGDDIISEVVEIHDNKDLTLILINPMKIVYMSGTNNNYLQIAFIPWVFRRICNEQNFSLSFDDILMTSETSSAINEYYWSSLDAYESAQDVNLESSSDEDKEEPEESNELKEIMEALMQAKRTYH